MRRELRARLAVTEPVHIEPRDAFVVRLRAAVAWVGTRAGARAGSGSEGCRLRMAVARARAGEVAGEARVAEDLDVAQVRLLRHERGLALERLAWEGGVGVF